MSETYTHRGHQITIDQDTEAESPREWDNLGTMICWHRRYWLGDRSSFGKDRGRQNKGPDFGDPEEFREYWKEHGRGGILIPLYLYDHSGLSISTEPFSCPWDSGQVGWIFCKRSTILKEYGGRIVTKSKRDKATRCLVAEVETYDQFLRGDVHGYRIEDEEGETLDSCWGIFGERDCKAEAEAASDRLATEREAEEAEENRQEAEREAIEEQTAAAFTY